MFQLVMSHIHDEAKYLGRDSDSCVSGIPDETVALSAALHYMQWLSKHYGVEAWTVVEDVTDVTRFSAFATLPGSTVYVEVQRMLEQTDVSQIVKLMDAKARYVVPDWRRDIQEKG